MQWAEAGVAVTHTSMNSKDSMLLLSQDYELFFGASGSVEKCLFEPCDALMQVAARRGLKITFFVDIGMLLCMDRLTASERGLASTSGKIRSHIGRLVAAGHEIALHIHPHWEDTGYSDGDWDFSATRYRLADFGDEEAADIVGRYAACLAEVAGAPATAYRAGGFCIEPFLQIRSALLDAGVTVDSSVVPGASLDDTVKGFDFRAAPSAAWWTFDQSPLQEASGGRFLEVPVSTQRLPAGYYWQRLLRRLSRRPHGQSFGDGSSKRIGRAEILRRLAGLSRTAELSTDDPKAAQLAEACASGAPPITHVMGHPKLLSRRSLEQLEEFVQRAAFDRFETVGGAASAVRRGEFPPPRHGASV